MDLHDHSMVLCGCEEIENDFCCGICGEEGDGISWVYRCRICPFVAHVPCVIFDYQIPSESEAEEESITTQLRILALDNESLEVEERSHEIILKPGITLQDILDSFSESDNDEYQNLYTAMAAETDDDDEDETNSEKYLNHFSFLEKPLYELIERLDLDEDGDSANPFIGFDRESPTDLAGGRYLISEKLMETFMKVFSKHGDISENSNLGIKVRTIVWNLFCNVLNDMSRTEFENITGELLVSWMIGVRTIQLAGFEVGFAFEGWKKIAMAFFGVQAKNNNIGDHQQDQLIAEMDQKIEEQRLKLQKLCQERENFLSFREKCLMEALAMEGDRKSVV